MSDTDLASRLAAKILVKLLTDKFQGLHYKNVDNIGILELFHHGLLLSGVTRAQPSSGEVQAAS